MNKLLGACAALAVVWGAGAAHATEVIGFDELGEGTLVDGQYAGLGVDFNGDATVLQDPNYNVAGYPPHSSPNVIYSPQAGFVEVVNLLGTWNSIGAWGTSGNGTLVLTAYDASNNIVGSSAWGDNYEQSTFHGVSGAGITRAVFSGDIGYFTLDDLTFEGAAGGVPEPGSWALMILGFGAAGAMLRRRQTAAAV